MLKFSRPVFTSGNHLTLLRCGKEYFPALLAAIAAAKQEIHLESYIFAKDAVGEAVSLALLAAVRRGVVVRVVVDGFGARNFAQDFLGTLTAGGVHCLLYRRELDPWQFKRRRLRRLHRKLVVIDGTTAFVGGINIVDDHNAPPGLAPRFDFAVQVRGQVVGQIHAAMRRLWEALTWARKQKRYRLPRAPLLAQATGTQVAAFLRRDNLLHRHDIAGAYLHAIEHAQSHILIANAYFLPGRRLRQALCAAAKRGVRVRLLIQGEQESDHRFLHFATQAMYHYLLEAGCEIFEYRQSFLHAKVAVIDQNWATVGSSNIDPFSLLLAQEGNLLVHDQGFAHTLRQELEHAIQTGANPIPPNTPRRPWWQRAWRWSCYELIRISIGLVGRAGQEW